MIFSFSDGKKAAEITNAVAFMIAKDNLPLDITEKEGFKYLMGIVCPLYKIPGRKKMTTVVESKYVALSHIVKELLHQAEWISLTADVWTETMTVTSFLGLTVHLLHDGCLKSIILGVYELSESHTSEYLSSCCTMCFNEWNIEINKVVAVVTDNGANITKCVTNIFGRNRHLPCFAHTINLVAQKIVDDDSVKNITKMRTIITYFRQSVSAADQFKKNQDSVIKLKLIQCVVTRWNSTYYMIERFLKLSDSVSSVLLKNPKSPEMLQATEIQICQELLLLLKPLEQISNELGGEQYVTCSKIIPAINCLKNKIENLRFCTNELQNLKDIVLKEIKKRFGSMEANKLLALSTLLDPRFKKIHFMDPNSCAEAINFVNKMLKERERDDTVRNQEVNNEVGNLDSDDNDIWIYHKLLSKSRQQQNIDIDEHGLSLELKQYLNSNTLSLESNPIDYWLKLKNSSDSFLADIALKYISVTGTSVPAERAFSQAANILTTKRNRLTGKHLSHLLFLHSIDSSYWK